MTSARPVRALRPSYSTRNGKLYASRIEDFLASTPGKRLRGQVQLVLTSPPFPLVSPKAYGNEQGAAYMDWLVGVMRGLGDLLDEAGSLVVEIGNAWTKGVPTMSTLPIRTLLAIADEANLHVCQQFIWENPAKLPGPATWVNQRRIRVKDSHTNVWWFSKSTDPSADNRAILTEYKSSQKRIMRTGRYNAGRRPSEHVISSSGFIRDNGGAIPGSVIRGDSEPDVEIPSLVSISNTSTDATYRRWCRDNEIPMHPARMPLGLAEFFIKFLTRPGDLVLDPFAGSNTTGRAAENLQRRWVATEESEEYAVGSRGRFAMEEKA